MKLHLPSRNKLVLAKWTIQERNNITDNRRSEPLPYEVNRTEMKI
jgi:hypothetical protein